MPGLGGQSAPPSLKLFACTAVQVAESSLGGQSAPPSLKLFA